MSEIAHLSGTVERILFKNEESGYYVFVLTIRPRGSTVVQAYAATLIEGERVTISGRWVVHPKFGKQLQADSCTTDVPTSEIGLRKYLGSGLIRGIGKVYADKLVDTFGTKVLEVIEHEPNRLSSVDGIGPKRVETIISAWQEQKSIARVMVFLQEKNVSPAYAAKIYKTYGQQAIAIITQNPYRLATDVWGIGFKTADQIAQTMGIASDSPIRIQAALIHTLNQATNSGHLYLPVDTLKIQTIALLESENDIAQQLLTQSLHELYQAGDIKLISHQERHFIATAKHYFTEKQVASRIDTLLNHDSCLNIDTEKAYTFLQKRSITLHEQQIKGIISCLTTKATIITGGPGTGKTTLVRSLLDYLDTCKLNYLLAAPTGRAAKRMSESTGRTAKTIHRLLEFNASTFKFEKNESNALKCHVLIVDESSMIDIFLAHAIIRAIPRDTHVLFLGDIHQLPSVGAGAFLHDLIESNVVNTIRLTTIFRQAQDSMIVVNAHKINEGIMPSQAMQGQKNDFIFIKENDPANVAGHLNNLLRLQLPREGFQPQQVMTLVPMHRGVVGAQTLNDELQHMLNPPNATKLQCQFRGTIYRIGDRIMQLRNNYDKLIFNGDTGYILDIDKENQLIQINADGRTIEYRFSELDEIGLAYAITIHKSQGSEYPVVIIPLFTQHYILLLRNLLYTAVTRAKQKCIIIGQPRAIAMAVANNKTIERITFLNEFLSSDLTAR